MAGRTTGSKNKVLHIWSKEEKEYLKQITPGHHYREIQNFINKKFDLNLTLGQIKGAISRYKLNTGFTGQFKKGNVPVNKGIKGVYAKGCEKTWFKKGNAPVNHRQVGSERITVDGYTEIKVEEPNKWRLKQQVIWEKYNGNIPKGHSILFGDGNKRNFHIDNLILVSRQQLLIMNRNKLIKTDADLTKTGLIIADIYQKIGQRKTNAIGTEEFNIMLQSSFVDVGDKEVLLKYTGLIKDEAVKSTGDDGVSQAVTIKTGVASVGQAVVPNPVALAPYRTFPEVQQPTSKFIFRMQQGPKAAIFEADGGAWRNQAMRSIKAYLQEELKEIQNINIIS